MLNWGDSRIGNMLYRDFAPVAVLDWEMATIGPPEIDVAWMVFLHRFFQDLAEKFELPGHPRLHGPRRRRRPYEELTGHTVEHLDWYEVFAALRFAIVSLRTSSAASRSGRWRSRTIPTTSIMFRPLLQEMLDRATPGS